VPVLRRAGPAGAASRSPPGRTGPAGAPGTVQARSAIAWRPRRPAWIGLAREQGEDGDRACAISGPQRSHPCVARRR
jgi:hypothetical protein